MFAASSCKLVLVVPSCTDTRHTGLSPKFQMSYQSRLFQVWPRALRGKYTLALCFHISGYAEHLDVRAL